MQITKIEEFHKNGALAYSDERIYFNDISELNADQQKKAIVSEDGKGFFRVNTTQKFFPNGQLAWKIDRNNNTFESFKEDGTVLTAERLN